MVGFKVSLLLFAAAVLMVSAQDEQEQGINSNEAQDEAQVRGGWYPVYIPYPVYINYSSGTAGEQFSQLQPSQFNYTQLFQSGFPQMPQSGFPQIPQTQIPARIPRPVLG